MIQVYLKNIVFSNEIQYPETECGKIAVIVTGHSGSFIKGEDIICSAVSALAQTMALSVKALAKINFPLIIKDGLLEVNVNIKSLDQNKREILSILMGSFIIGITEIYKAHPQEINIEFIKEEI